MARFLLHHRHEAEDCGVVFASFRGHESSLRHRDALATCAFGGHAIFWAVEAVACYMESLVEDEHWYTLGGIEEGLLVRGASLGDRHGLPPHVV